MGGAAAEAVAATVVQVNDQSAEAAVVMATARVVEVGEQAVLPQSRRHDNRDHVNSAGDGSSADAMQMQ